MRVWERRLAVPALVTVVAAWAVGWSGRQQDLAPFLAQALSGADRFEKCHTDIFTGWGAVDDEQRIVGYVAVGQANGYGGPMRVAVGVDKTGEIRGFAVVDHAETTA